MTIADIIARLEAGETGRDIDLAIARATEAQGPEVEPYTTSIDACRELHNRLLPGWHYELHSYDNSAKVWFDRPDTMPHRAKSLPAAWLIAILKAWEWEAQQ